MKKIKKALLIISIACLSLFITTTSIFAKSYNINTNKSYLIAQKEESINIQKEEKKLPACVNTNCNCKDFANQKQAQKVLEAFATDVHGLDRDKDGIACENLPKS